MSSEIKGDFEHAKALRARHLAPCTVFEIGNEKAQAQANAEEVFISKILLK